MRIIAIDPGMNGAIAGADFDVDGALAMLWTVNMPEGMTGIADELRALKRKESDCAFIEKVGTYVHGNSGPASVKFARHCGNLESALYCIGFSTTEVLPNTWMKALGTMPKDKQERKRKIKEMMQRRFPSIKVTLVNADALGILVYGASQKGHKI
jgi:hypothetical protein